MTPPEVDAILDVLRDHTQRLARIEEHAEKTNGRVTALELWKARAVGAAGMVALVAPFVVAVVK